MRELGFTQIYIIVYFRDTLGYLNSHCSQDHKNNMGYYSADFAPQDHPRKYLIMSGFVKLMLRYLEKKI